MNAERFLAGWSNTVLRVPGGFEPFEPTRRGTLLESVSEDNISLDQYIPRKRIYGILSWWIRMGSAMVHRGTVAHG